MEKNLRVFVSRIKNLKIQGAQHIAVASLKYIKKHSQHSQLSQNIPKYLYLKHFKELIKLIEQSRPTEPLTFNLLNYLESSVSKKQNLNTENLPKKVIKEITYLESLLNNSRIKIEHYGQVLIKSNQNILTHCHSSEVENILIKSHASGKKFKVFNTETRPLFQGRITAKNLLKKNISTTMVADSAASFLISESSGKNVMIDVAFLGADAILPDGSVINKIGSYGIALSCYHTKVPLYIVSPLLKYDPTGLIKIEIRPEEELWPNRPKALKIINFAFDKIPAEFITGIITEFGIIKPLAVKRTVLMNYKNIFSKE
jgi:ribose 1,5-bisphosphate isomerase